MHRWTAGALARITSEAEQSAAHCAAAAYWRWRVDKLLQSRENDIDDLLEARYHLHATHDFPKFYEVSGTIILQLETWGAWEWEKRLLLEILAAMPEGSRESESVCRPAG